MEEARNVIQEAEAVAEVAETHAEVGTPQRFEGIEGAINVSIVAFSIVFGVLLVLTAMIFAVRIFAADDDEPEANVKKNDTKLQPVAAPAKPAAAAAPVAVASASAAPAPVINASAAATPQTKIVAAITAAIMAATHGAGQIVSIQPALALPDAAGASKNAPSFGSSAWKTSGRIALVHNRLNRSWR